MPATHIYEVINPSDAVTFRAVSDAVAFAVVLHLGRGKAGCTKEDGTSLPTLMLFASKEQYDEAVASQCGYFNFPDFMRFHIHEIADAYESFAYGTISDRLDYDAAIEAITEPEKLEAFKAHHEDKRRTSMNQWVKAGWSAAEACRNFAKKHPIELLRVNATPPGGLRIKHSRPVEPRYIAEAIKAADAITAEGWTASITLQPEIPET